MSYRSPMPNLRPIHYKTLVCLFELEGFRQTREEGDHLILENPCNLRLPSCLGGENAL